MCTHTYEWMIGIIRLRSKVHTSMWLCVLPDTQMLSHICNSAWIDNYSPPQFKKSTPTLLNACSLRMASRPTVWGQWKTPFSVQSAPDTEPIDGSFISPACLILILHLCLSRPCQPVSFFPFSTSLPLFRSFLLPFFYPSLPPSLHTSLQIGHPSFSPSLSSCILPSIITFIQ